MVGWSGGRVRFCSGGVRGWERCCTAYMHRPGVRDGFVREDVVRELGGRCSNG